MTNNAVCISSEKINDKGNRINWIDVAKGICIISVVIGHLNIWDGSLNRIIYAFHLPVFFILSGYTLKKEDVNRTYLNKKFKSLMIPYFITCFCIMCADMVKEIIRGASLESFTEIISIDLIRSFWASGSSTFVGNIDLGTRIGAIWFLPALFFALIFTQLILKFVHKAVYRFILAYALLLIAVMSGQIIWLPFSIQSSMMAIIFLLLGYELKNSALLDRLDWQICIIFIIIFIICFFMHMTMIRFSNATIDDIFITLISSISISLVVLYLARKLEKCRPLAWIGKNSLIVLCVHLFELDTMGRWPMHLLEGLSIKYNIFFHLLLELIFILLGTEFIVLIKKGFTKMFISKKVGGGGVT